MLVSSSLADPRPLCFNLSMTAAKLQNDEIFNELQDADVDTALNFAIANQIEIIGQTTDDDTKIFINLQSVDASRKILFGVLQSSSSIFKPEQSVLMSFVIGNHKYLFKAKLSRKDLLNIKLEVSSKFYSIQRRNNERIKVPSGYYAIVKITHIGNQPVKAFASLNDISTGGLAISVKGGQPQIQRGQILKATISFKIKPPEEIEALVRHVRINKSGESVTQIVGGSLLPENSIQVTRRITSVILDIYRESIKSMTED